MTWRADRHSGTGGADRFVGVRAGGGERGDQGDCPDCNVLGECTTECAGQSGGEPSCDEKINYWMMRHREACEELARVRAELARAEAVLVAADRVSVAYQAMLEGREVGRLAEWEGSER